MTRKISLLLVLFLAVSLISAPVSASAENAMQITDISYMDDTNDNHLLDIYGAEQDALKPVVIDIHGGGFFGGTKENNILHNQMYADAGFAVVAMNYTLMPEADFITIEQELFAVLKWIEHHAEEYGLDTDRIVIGGDSAGGFLSLLTASIIASEDLQNYYGVTPPAYTIKGYVLSCPVTDLDSLRDAEKGFKSFMAGKMNQTVFEDESVYRHVDLYKIIDPATFPEVYIITTPTDTNFYPDAVKFDAFLTENGIPHHYHEYVGKEQNLKHVFNVSDPETEEGKEANQASFLYLYDILGISVPEK